MLELLFHTTGVTSKDFYQQSWADSQNAVADYEFLLFKIKAKAVCFGQEKECIETEFEKTLSNW